MMVLPVFFAFSSNAGNVNVKVKIANPYGKVVNIQVADKTYEIVMDETGVGSVDVDVKDESFVTFDYPRVMQADLYLLEGKDLEISFDLKKRAADLAVKCDDGGINNYLFDLMMKGAISREDYKLEESEFLKKIDQLIEGRIKDLSSKSFSKKFKKIQEENLTFSIAKNLAEYPMYFAWATNNKEYKASEKYYQKLESFIKDKSSLLNLNSYKGFMAAAINTIASKNIEGYQPLKVAEESSKMASKLKTQALKDELIFNYTEGVISRSGVDGTEELLELFKSNVKDTEKVKAVNELVSKWSKLAEGQPSPKFNYEDINGKMVSLDDLKGKYVYIDCWATWCGPCCKEIPHLQELEHDYASKNIHFVSISCDKNKNAWETKVKNDKLGGVQLIIGRDRSFMDAYMVSGIPRFILLDKDGNIVKADAPRPSTKEIRILLNGLKGL